MSFLHIRRYLVIALIPTLLISFIIFYQKSNDLFQDRSLEAYDQLTKQKKEIDRLLGDTKARMDTIATFIPRLNQETNWQQLLFDLSKEDPRFSGMYLVNTEGYFQYGSRPFDENVSIKSRPYFQEARDTKSLSISEPFIGRFSNHHIIVLCMPILSAKDDILYYFITTINVDLVEKKLKTEKNEIIYIENNQEEVLLRFGASLEKKEMAEKISIPLDEVDWTLSKNVTTLQPMDILQPISPIILFVFFTTHFLFLVFEINRFKKEANLEKLTLQAERYELMQALAVSTAHEIRNPLAGIKGFVQLLNEKYKDDEDQHYFSVIKTELTRLSHIVDDLHMLGKKVDQYEDSRTDIVEMLKEISPIISAECHVNGITFDVDFKSFESKVIKGSKDQLKQVVLNLTKNAIQAMEHGGTLTIRITENSNRIYVRIEDTGIGIPEDKLDQIYQPYYTSKQSGTGLGLAISKSIIELFDGTIHIESIEHIGTTVTVSFPIHK